MRFHLLSLPSAQTTKAYDLCGFTQVTIRFARLLKNLGHTVFLYASEENEAPCDELIQIITKEEQETLLGATMPEATPYQYAYIEDWSPIWQLANARMVKEIRRRMWDRDFIASIGGWSQRPVHLALPHLMFVEYSIGYNGSFSDYRVFESQAWRHVSYGAQQVVDGRNFDTVIPCFYDPAEFPFKDSKEPFALYVGRLIPRKGLEVACRAAEAAGLPLKVIGHGDKSLVTHGAEYLGALPAPERNAWMASAQALILPTVYVEPFNQVAVEAQFCGTPVVSSDFGGFVETVEQGKTGFRCHYLGEYVRGLLDAAQLDPAAIRARAERLYSMDTAAGAYQAYFNRLMLLWEDGFNSLEGAPVLPSALEEVS